MKMNANPTSSNSSDTPKLIYLCIYYCFLIALCWGGIWIVDSITTGNTEEYKMIAIYSKVIKCASYFFILFGLVAWTASLESDKNKSFYKYFAIMITFFSAILILWMGIQTSVYSTSQKVILSTGYYGDGAISMIPLILMLIMNIVLSITGSHKQKTGSRYFLFIVYLPVFFAVGTVFLLILLGQERFTKPNLSLILSGAMAFLVFITHCLEKAVEKVIIEPSHN